MIDFTPVAGKPAPIAGLVLRVGESEPRYLRITHVFEDCVFSMWVSGPERARYARRPAAISLLDLKYLTDTPTSVWGRIALPPAFANEPAEGSERSIQFAAAWGLVSPLIKAFEQKSNLRRQSFTALIREHALATHTSHSTLVRMVLRYYYFGGTRLALLPLPPGVKPGFSPYTDASEEEPKLLAKRRGRQSILSDELGRNEFVVSQADIDDMTGYFRALLKNGPAFKTSAHEGYLAGPFRKRHPEEFKEYIEGRKPEPVTSRQFRYYVDGYLRVTGDLARNVRTYQRNPGYLGSVRAAGPGEIYEIDATGGRFHLVSSSEPIVSVGKPTIYLLIDRWSRFIVSIFISLRAPSYEEVRHALLIAFTSREARFSRMGVNVSDERWPIGRIPAVICPDRGSDFMSESMEQSVVLDLRIDLTPLPPLCPDGKAIVERFILELKRRMAASGIKGVYANRPLDPVTKRAARNAEAAAVRTLSDAYRLLVDIVNDHNNRPHSTLRRRRILTQAGIQPTPKNAYLWGLENISGLRSAPLSEDDYFQLLLSTDKASISNGVITYKSRPYRPDNEPAVEMARHSGKKSKQIAVRIDKTFPTVLYVSNSQGTWAKFAMTGGASNDISGMSLDEEEALAGTTARLWAKAEHSGRISRIASKESKRAARTGTGEPAVKLPKNELMAARNRETAELKGQLLGAATPQKQEDSQEPSSSPELDWMRLEEEERLKSLALIRKHRSQQ